MSPLGFLGRDLAIDLGTATTQIYERGRGIVLNEPSAAALKPTGGFPFGIPAFATGTRPGTSTHRPTTTTTHPSTPARRNAHRNPHRNSHWNAGPDTSPDAAAHPGTHADLIAYLAPDPSSNTAHPPGDARRPPRDAGHPKPEPPFTGSPTTDARFDAAQRPTPERPSPAGPPPDVRSLSHVASYPTADAWFCAPGYALPKAPEHQPGETFNPSAYLPPEPTAGVIPFSQGSGVAAAAEMLFGVDAVRHGGIAQWPVHQGGELVSRMIKHFVRKVHGHPFARPRLVMALPDGASPILRAALRDLAYEADARRVFLVEHSFAVALGAGLPITEPAGRMIVDIGPRLTRIAILACGAVVAARTIHTGGDAVNAAIAALVAREHNLLLGEAEAEAVKLRAGPSWKPLDRHVIVRGLDPDSRHERVAWLPVQQLYEVTRAQADAIARGAAATLEHCPAELSADVAAHGAVLTGGGALLRGLARRLRAAMGIPVRRADRPVEALALGLGRYVDRLNPLGPRHPV